MDAPCRNVRVMHESHSCVFDTHIFCRFWPGRKAASWMMKQGAEVDPEDIHHDTPLLYACTCHHNSIVNIYIQVLCERW